MVLINVQLIVIILFHGDIRLFPICCTAVIYDPPFYRRRVVPAARAQGPSLAYNAASRPHASLLGHYPRGPGARGGGDLCGQA